jgi:hypothetical protein
MNAAADPEEQATRCIGFCQIALHLERCCDCIAWIVERSVYSVAGHFHHSAAIIRHGRAYNRVMVRQRGTHPLGFLLPKPGAALDVREKKCRDGRRAWRVDFRLDPR